MKRERWSQVGRLIAPFCTVGGDGGFASRAAAPSSLLLRQAPPPRLVPVPVPTIFLAPSAQAGHLRALLSL